MSWLGDVWDKTTEYVTMGLPEVIDRISGGDGSGEQQTYATEDTNIKPAPRTLESAQMWNDFMREYDNLESNMANIQQSREKITKRYSDTLKGLSSTLDQPQNQVSFGIEGMSPISFTQRPAIQKAQAQAGILGQGYNANIGSLDRNNDYFTTLNQLANQGEQLRYGLPQTSQTATATQPGPGPLDYLSAFSNFFV